MSSGQVPASLHEKFTLLRYFAQYMDENLTEGGEGGARGGAKLGQQRSGGSNPNLAIPQIKRWIRAPKAIIMHLTNGTIQVTRVITSYSVRKLCGIKYHTIISIPHSPRLLAISFECEETIKVSCPGPHLFGWPRSLLSGPGHWRLPGLAWAGHTRSPGP